MSHALARFTAPSRTPNKTGWRWPRAKERKLELSPSGSGVQTSGWGSITPPECEEEKIEISAGYKSAIALLRSLRNVSEEEAREQRETWELLEQALDEDKYH